MSDATKAHIKLLEQSSLTEEELNRLVEKEKKKYPYANSNHPKKQYHSSAAVPEDTTARAKNSSNPGWGLLGIILFGGILAIVSPILGSIFGIVLAGCIAVHVFRK